MDRAILIYIKKKQTLKSLQSNLTQIILSLSQEVRYVT